MAIAKIYSEGKNMITAKMFYEKKKKHWDQCMECLMKLIPGSSIVEVVSSEYGFIKLGKYHRDCFLLKLSKMFKTIHIKLIFDELSPSYSIEGIKYGIKR